MNAASRCCASLDTRARSISSTSVVRHRSRRGLQRLPRGSAGFAAGTATPEGVVAGTGVRPVRRVQRRCVRQRNRPDQSQREEGGQRCAARPFHDASFIIPLQSRRWRRCSPSAASCCRSDGSPGSRTRYSARGNRSVVRRVARRDGLSVDGEHGVPRPDHGVPCRQRERDRPAIDRRRSGVGHAGRFDDIARLPLRLHGRRHRTTAAGPTGLRRRGHRVRHRRHVSGRVGGSHLVAVGGVRRETCVDVASGRRRCDLR